jgi:pyruvate kinase
MVARGVEVGSSSRPSEVHEEILWICEAGHVPVIWATQELESFARSGVPTRAEVTDAALGGRVEAVMLNKEPFMLNVLALLKDTLIRIGDREEDKKKVHLKADRKLSLARDRSSSTSSKGEPVAAGASAAGAAAAQPKRKKK